MEAAARRAGVLANVVVVGPDLSRHASTIRALRQLRPRALILNYVERAPLEVRPELEAFEREGGRVVSLGGLEDDYVSVRFDDDASGALMGRHLLELGRSRFAVVTAAHPSHTARVEALLEVLADAGIDRASVPVRVCGVSAEEGRMAARALSRLDPPPDVIYVAADAIAVGVIAGLREVGLRVPEDVAVGSNDGLPVAAAVDPPLTTVALDFAGAGRVALGMALDDDAPREHRHLPGRLLVRASTQIAG